MKKVTRQEALEHSVPEQFAYQGRPGPDDWRGLVQFCRSHGTFQKSGTVYLEKSLIPRPRSYAGLVTP
ncbi:hypothetical protein N7523_007138 [Penicillium sp. IBT 18751x]|nr:hypothetical protein N7523_007138 [Penicillium sp. IBT 18751x]